LLSDKNKLLLQSFKYGERLQIINKKKQNHPEENSSKLPLNVRKHFDSWKDMAKELGYDE